MAVFLEDGGVGCCGGGNNAAPAAAPCWEGGVEPWQSSWVVAVAVVAVVAVELEEA
jgi:hypothetical protein